MSQRATLFALLGLFTVLSTWNPAPAQTKPDDKELVRFGIIDSLFQEKDEGSTRAQMQPFADMIKKRTGLNGEFTVVRGADTMGREMKAGKLHMGVLHGVEFGWLREQCPECQPLLVAINETTDLKAVVLVAKDNPAKSIFDLKGQPLAMPGRPPHHVRFYLERLIKDEPAKVFKMTEAANTDAAIEAVIDGTAQVTVVSNVALEVYRKRKPGRFNRLKLLEESPTFPAAVVVYRPGDKSKEESLKQFKESLLKANDTPEGQRTLTLWRLSGFEEVPKNYDKQVEEIVKLYPPPN